MRRITNWLWVMMAGLAISASPGGAQQISRSAWFELISSGQVEQVRVLISSGKVGVLSTVDDQNNTPLHLAAERCNTGMVKMLLSQRADPLLRNKWNDTPLIIAAVRCGKTAPVTQLIAQAASNRSQLGTPTVAAGRTGSTSSSSSGTRPSGTPSSGPSAAGPNLVGVQALSVPGGGSRNACFSVGWQVVTPTALRTADRMQNYNSLIPQEQNYQGTQMLVGTNRCPAAIFAIAASCGDVLTEQNERLGFDVTANRDFLTPGTSMILGFRFTEINRLSQYDTGVPVERHNFVVAAYSAVDAKWLESHRAVMNDHYKVFERRLNVVLVGHEAEFTIPHWSGVYAPNPQAARLYGHDKRSCEQTKFLENW